MHLLSRLVSNAKSPAFHCWRRRLPLVVIMCELMAAGGRRYRLILQLSPASAGDERSLSARERDSTAESQRDRGGRRSPTDATPAPLGNYQHRKESRGRQMTECLNKTEQSEMENANQDQ